jgi:predicted patatin/cPLA2 family phospholipase
MHRLALVMHGGGMRGAYGAGLIIALERLLGKGKIPLVLGTSAGAVNAAAVTAGYTDVMHEVWTDVLHREKYIHPYRLRWITDNHYLMRLLAQYGFTNERVKNSPIQLFITATHFITGENHFFTNQDDIIEAIHASISMPILCETPIYVGGEPFLDGGISSSTGKHVEKAFQEGADKIIALDLSIHLQWINHLGLRWYARTKAPGLKRAIARMRTEPYPEPLAPDPRVYLIRPHHLVVSRLTRAPWSLKRAFDMGMQETLGDERLRKFLGLQ